MIGLILSTLVFQSQASVIRLDVSRATATNSDYFLNPGYAGSVTTGIEPFSIQTGTSFPNIQGVYPLIVPDALSQDAGFEMQKNWGSLSPSATYPSSIYGLPNASALIPESCELKQVHLLYRHGARYPTSGSGKGSTVAFYKKLQNSTFTASGPLQFLNKWNYTLGEAELTSAGRQEAFNFGIASRFAYGGLLDRFKKVPVFWTTSEDRVLKTAMNFAAGFFGIPTEDQYNLEIIIESKTPAGFFNSTGGPSSKCPNPKEVSKKNTTDQYTEVAYLPAATRLNKYIAGFNVTTDDISSMLMLCAYETVSLGYSSFCPLFEQSDFEAFEYFYDLTFYYNEGFASNYAAARGLGYLQETYARLTQTPISIYNSTTNSTIDSNPITNPLDQPIYAMATHDNTIMNILTAFNLTSIGSGPPSRIVPFVANFITQVIFCGVQKNIRFVLNGAVVPHTFAGCPDDSNGLCPFDTVLCGMNARIQEIDFQKICFEN